MTARGIRGIALLGSVVVMGIAAGVVAGSATADYGPVPVTHYDCANDNSDLGHYVPYNRYWEQDFVSQGTSITGGYLALGANVGDHDHTARVGIYTGSNRSGPLAEIQQQVIGYSGFNFTFPTSAVVSPGQHLYVAATGVGDFTAYDSRAGCFIGRLDGFKPPPPDHAAPTATAFTFGPSDVNVADGAATISATIHLADDVSGIKTAGRIAFTGPGSGRVTGALSRTSGSELDGFYVATVTVPQNAVPGTWQPRLEGVTDAAGNALTDGAAPPSTPATLTVRSEHPDTVAPVIVGFDFSPKAIDAGGSVHVTIRVTDDHATPGPEALGFMSPGGRIEQATVRRDGGTDTDGSYSADVTIPRDAAGGTWKARITGMHDAAANSLPDGPPPSGMPTDLQVTAAPPPARPPPPPPPPPTFRYRIANVTSVNLRAQPNSQSTRIATLAGGSVIDIVCQTAGENINGSVVWDKLNNDSYVSDWYTTTPAVGDYSPGIPHCAGAPGEIHPPAPQGRWKVVAGAAVNTHSAPSTSAPTRGALSPGSRFDIACQTYGTYVLGSPVWDKLPDGRYITDYYTDTPVYANFSPGIGACPGTGARPGPPTGSSGGAGSSGGGISTSGSAPRLNYVALGDSFSSGEGVPDDGRVGFTRGQACHRSSLAYPVRFAQRVGIELSRFTACSGDVADQLQRDQLPGIGSGGARLVTVTIGGNDMHFPDIISDCVTRIQSCDQIYSDMTRQINNFKPTLVYIYKQIAAKAKGGHIVVVGYPKFFPSPGHACTNAPGIFGGEQNWINERIIQFDGVARSAAAAANVEFVNPDGRAFVGHDVCASQNYINGVDIDNRVYSFHPNAAGHSVMAQALIDHGVR